MSDLDARVAALMGKIVNHRYVPIELVDANRADLEQAIRAELQKTALHEPVTDDEILAAIQANRSLGYAFERMKRTLESFLQGRAKPAQEEITDEQLEAAAKQLAACGDYPWQHMPPEGRNRMRIHARAIIRASKGEKT